jgi:signal transduction histidine kinase
MGTGRGHHGAWRALYLADRDELLLVRLRWCAFLNLVGGFFVATQAFLHLDDHARLHLSSAVGYITVSGALGAACYTTVGRRHLTAVGMGYLIALTSVFSASLARMPEQAAVIPAVLVALMLGTTLLLPWDAGRQAIVCAGAIVAFAGGGMGTLPPSASGAAVALVLSAAAVSVAGTRLVERYRANAFERTWQQEQLVAFARALAAQVESVGVIDLLVERAPQLVPMSSMIVALRNAQQKVYRVVAHTSSDEAMVGLEAPDDLEPIRRIVSRDIVNLPGDDPGNAVNDLLATHGVHQVLYVTLRHGDDVVGLLAFIRKEDRAFGSGERLIAHGLADQTALALRTARLVDDLRHANQLKSEFVSTMSHELRTPINVILGYADMLEDPGFDASERGELLARTRMAGRELLDLVENTLAIGRFESGHDELALETVSLPALWKRLGECSERIPRRNAVALVWERGVPDLSLVTDPRKVEIVIRNLIGNAFKFTERGTVRATLALEDGGDTVAIEVADTGIGIGPEDQRNIFEMFRQADASDTRRYGGTGLGLYIVRRFVEQLGGSTSLESTLGRGSRFTVRFPTRRIPAARAAA